jgi:DNA-binding NarL/FixJ family response regulator
MPRLQPETAPPSNVTRVAVVEDNAALGAALEQIVDSGPGFRCVGVWTTAEKALAEIPAVAPDVVLMDIHLPGMNGIEATARLKQQFPELPVIMVTVYRDHDKIFQALKAGACGYLLKRSTPAEIRRAIFDVRAGGAPMSAEIARRVVETFHAPPQASVGEESNLSRRQREILELLSTGLANKEIADRLGLSTETVRVHLKHIYDKLHVRCRTEAAAKYLSRGGAIQGP